MTISFSFSRTCLAQVWTTSIASSLIIGTTTVYAQAVRVSSFTGTCAFDADGINLLCEASNPRGVLVQGDDGNFYGTAFGTGSGGNYGEIYRLTPAGAIETIFSFRPTTVTFGACGPPAGLNRCGSFPIGRLTKGSDGAFYGVASGDGLNTGGTLFRVTSAGSLSVLHDFAKGSQPFGGLVQTPDGSLYGTTQFGGDFGLGTVFRYATDGSFTTLHSFTGVDGQWPIGDVMLASNGKIYGTTLQGGGGGVSACGSGNGGCGTIFRFTPPGTFEMVHAFAFVDGHSPLGGLVEGIDGNVYGTTNAGGAPGASGGTFFRLAPDGTLTTLHEFTGTAIGPVGGVLQATDGNFYGATDLGPFGPLVFGTLFRITPDGTHTTLYSFSGPDGRRPLAGLAQGNDGHLYGTTYDGGTSNCGVAFRLDIPPAAQDSTFGTDEDVTASGTLVATDFERDLLTFTLAGNGGKGTAVITNTTTGAFSYTPNQNANGSDSFTFKANDGILNSGVATVNITIAPVNDAPVALDGTATTLVGTPVSGTLTASDIDGDALTFSVFTNGTKGTAVVTNPATGAFTYTPSAGNSGVDTFTFHAFDGTIFSNTATVMITISSGANKPPIASDGALITLEDRPARGTLTAVDPEGSPLRYAIVANGAKGNATIINPSTGLFAYVPRPNANGADSFTFMANDGQLNSNVATFSVGITPVNDAPVATSASYLIAINANLFGTLIAKDVDGDSVIYAIHRQPRGGVARILNSATGAFRYTPNMGVRGVDSFTFKATDPSGAVGLATIRITINRCGC